MARRFGCFVLVALLVLGLVGTALVWLVLSAVGVIGSAPFVRLVSAIGLVLGLAAIAISLLLIRRFTRRAERLVDAAHRIEAGDYSARVPVRGPSELRALARAFNAMSSRLEAEEARRESVLADIAHELRTPLSIIRGQAEGIVDGVYAGDAAHVAPILAATSTIETLVEDLRTLGLAETGSLRLHLERIDLGVLVNETLAGLQTSAERAGVRLLAEINKATPAVEGDPVRLRSVLDNLVNNALRHTPRGGTIRITSDSRADGAARLSIHDDGEGIPPDLLPRVFDRFVKGSSSSGSGLGLAIVRDVVAAHGGSVNVRSDPGEGTTFDITLPVDPE